MRIAAKLSRIAYNLAASCFGGWVVRAGLLFMENFQSDKVVFSGQFWIAFEHPQPSYPFHVLFVARRAIPGLLAPEACDPALLAELVTAVQQLVNSHDLAERGYRLVCNGGEYQQVPRLHFHLFTD